MCETESVTDEGILAQFMCLTKMRDVEISLGLQLSRDNCTLVLLTEFVETQKLLLHLEQIFELVM